MGKRAGRYTQIIESIFRSHYKGDYSSFTFKREEIVDVCKRLGLKVPKNLGDVIYNFRYRANPPELIANATPPGKQWVIRSRGDAIYQFRLVSGSDILPNKNLITIKIPDATPNIVLANAKSDEQALLAIVRYNRLVDIFLGLAAYSVQNHLRTKVDGFGQIEIDEIYVGLNSKGEQYVIPVQAKGGSDKIGYIQVEQDIACCKEKYGALICRSVAVQFAADNLIAMFELIIVRDTLKIVNEKHYRLVDSEEISTEDLRAYSMIG